MSKLENGIRGYTQWREALWSDDGLREMASVKNARDIRATAEVIALRGANGRGCFVGTTAIAARTGTNRHTAGQHRNELIRLGWLRKRGHVKRTPLLDIALPVGSSYPPTAPLLADEPPTEAPNGSSRLPLSDSTRSDKATIGVEAPGGTSPTTEGEQGEQREGTSVGSSYAPIGYGYDSDLDGWLDRRKRRPEPGSRSAESEVSATDSEPEAQPCPCVCAMCRNRGPDHPEHSCPFMRVA